MLLPTLLGGIVRWTLSLLNGVSFSIICNRPFRAFQCSDTPRFKCAQNSGALPNRVVQWCSIKQVSFLASNVVRLPILQITSFSPPHKRGVDSGEAVEGFAQKKFLPIFAWKQIQILILIANSNVVTVQNEAARLRVSHESSQTLQDTARHCKTLHTGEKSSQTQDIAPLRTLTHCLRLGS